MSKYSELAQEIAEEVAVMSRRKFYEGRTVKLKKDIAVLIDEKLSGVREIVKPMADEYKHRAFYKSYWSDILKQAADLWQSLKVD